MTPRLHAAVVRTWAQRFASAEYGIHRALAWRAALAGHDAPAFARLLSCVSKAPSATQQFAAIVDRAELAREIGNDILAYEELRRVSALASQIEWDSTTLDDTIVLSVAKAVVCDDATVEWLSLYRRRVGRADPHLTRNQRRRSAFESEAEASILETENASERALRTRREILETWNHLGYAWRAAREAVAIAQLSKSAKDVAMARRLSTAFPKAWFTRRPRRRPSP